MSEDVLKIGEHSFSSRLFVGTGKYRDMDETRAALSASGSEVVTVAVRRVDLGAKGGESLIGHLLEKKYVILPNTAGCYTAEEAVRTAKLAREILIYNQVAGAGFGVLHGLPWNHPLKSRFEVQCLSRSLPQRFWMNCGYPNASQNE